MAGRTEQELIARIERLEAENSALRDKLDMIYSIVADDSDAIDAESDDDHDDKSPGGLVQIDPPR